MVDAVSKALPHQKEFLKRYGVGGTYFLLEELENALLAELRRFLREGQTSNESISLAAEMLVF